MNQNEFLDIPGYEGYYKINLNQEVMTVPRSFVSAIGRNYRAPTRIRKPVTDADGYLRVGLCVNGKAKLVAIHRLMAMTFISNPDNKPHVNHKNGVKTDNSIENLEWCTAADNNRHAWKTGLNKPITGEGHWNHGKKGPNAGKYGSELKQTKLLIDTQTGIFYHGAREAAIAKNINLNNLRGKMAGFIRNDTGLIYV